MKMIFFNGKKHVLLRLAAATALMFGLLTTPPFHGRVEAGVFGGAVGGGLVGGLVGGRKGMVGGAIIGGVVGGVAKSVKKNRKHTKWRYRNR
jgi:hypothetical protein